MPGFPSLDLCKSDPSYFHLAVAGILHDISVGHSCDHFSFGQLDVFKVPIRLRVPPPANTSHVPKTMISYNFSTDLFKALEFYKFLVQPSYNTFYKTQMNFVQYRFTDPPRKKAAQKFRNALFRLDGDLCDPPTVDNMNIPHGAIPRYCPLDVLSQCLEY